MKDLAKKVETIDLSGSGLVGGKKRRGARKSSKKSRSSSRRKTGKSRSSSRKRSGARKSSASKRASKKSSSPSKKITMGINEHKLADNLIQLGVQLKNMQLDGGRRKRKRPTAKKWLILCLYSEFILIIESLSYFNSAFLDSFQVRSLSHLKDQKRPLFVTIVGLVRVYYFFFLYS